MGFFTEDLLESVKRRTFAPISQQTFTTESLIELLNDELDTTVVPALVSARENFFLTSSVVALSDGLNRVTIPERASGNAIKGVWYLDSSGRRTHTLSHFDITDFPTGENTGQRPSAFAIEGDELVLSPTPASPDGSLEIWYVSRPNRLVGVDSTAKITAISSVGGTTTFTVDTDLTGSLSSGEYVDFLSAKSPFLLWARDVSIASISATEIAVATSEVSNDIDAVEPVVGDYICVAQESCIPMLPIEWHPVLAQAAAVQVLDALGDLNKKASAEARLEKLKTSALKLVVNRVESEPERIVNRFGILDAQSEYTNGIVYR